MLIVNSIKQVLDFSPMFQYYTIIQTYQILSVNFHCHCKIQQIQLVSLVVWISQFNLNLVIKFVMLARSESLIFNMTAFEAEKLQWPVCYFEKTYIYVFGFMYSIFQHCICFSFLEAATLSLEGDKSTKVSRMKFKKLI